MKEYSIIKIACEKGIKIADIYSKIKDNVKINSNFFEFQNLFSYSNKKNEIILNEIGIDRYAYTKVLPHLVQSKFYEPERDDRKMLSNLDDRWEWSNPNINDPLSEEDFSKLVNFCDSLSVSSLSTMILGFDEIEWDGTKPEKGTYGYNKAKSTYDFGENYLSNSVIIARDYEVKKYTVIISCEKRFRELEVIGNLIEFLGKIQLEKNYFAPETNFERAEWEKLKSEKWTLYNSMFENIDSLPLQDITRQFGDNKRKVNIKEYIKNYLCTDGWDFRKKNADELGMKISIDKGDTCISMCVISRHNGHHLQVFLKYDNEKFCFSKSLKQTLDAEDEEEIKKYFQNLKIIKDHMYNSL